MIGLAFVVSLMTTRSASAVPNFTIPRKEHGFKVEIHPILQRSLLAESHALSPMQKVHQVNGGRHIIVVGNCTKLICDGIDNIIGKLCVKTSTADVHPRRKRLFRVKDDRIRLLILHGHGDAVLPTA